MTITAVYKTNSETTDVMMLEKAKVKIEDGWIYTYNEDGDMTGSHQLNKFVNICIED